MAVSTYESEIAAVARRPRRPLKADGGWLSLAGLFWLHEGSNPFGKDPSNEIALPDGPAHAGAFHLHDGKVTLAAQTARSSRDTDAPARRWARASFS